MKRLEMFLHEMFLQQLYRNMGAGLGIGEGVVVMFQIEAARFRHCVQLVVGQLFPEVPACGTAGAAEPVAGILHLVGLEHGFEASLVEGAVVCHEGQSGDARGDLFPHVREGGCGLGVFWTQAVHFLTEPRVVVRHGMDEAVEGVGDDTVAYDHHTDAAHAAALSVGGLEVNSCKVFHVVRFVPTFQAAKVQFFTAAKIGYGYAKRWHNKWKMERWGVPPAT